MSLMDLGGGYMSELSTMHYETGEGEQITFGQTAAVLREEIDKIRGSFENLKLIAEPGRFFAADCMTLAIRVFGRRVLFDMEG